jgi:hypothetical protein
MSSFGTPSAAPIIHSFLSGNATVDPFVNEEQKAEITLLQNDVFEVEKEKFMEDKRTKEAIARAKEIQETSRKSKLVYGKIEDRSVEELNQMVHDFSQIEQEISDRLGPQQPSHQLEVGGSRDPFLGNLSFSSSPSSHILMPPRRLPWTPIQPSLQLPRSSWSLPHSSRSQSTLLNPSMLPSAQAQPMPLFQHNHMPQHPSAVHPPHAQMILSPTETCQYNYNTQGLHINGNISQPFSQSSLIPALLPQQLSTPLPIEAEPDLVEQPENHASTQSFTGGHPFANHHWPSPIPSNDPYYDINLNGVNFYMGDHGDDYGNQAAGEHDMPGPVDLHQQVYDCPYRNFLGSSSSGESPGDYGQGNNVGDMESLNG